MTGSAANLPCQFPKTARLAAMILMSPIIEFQIKHNPELPKGKYRTNAAIATIEASEIPIPSSILRDQTVRFSLSVNEVMISLKSDIQLRSALPELANAMGVMHDNVLKLTECGLKNERVPPEVLKAFAGARQEALNIF